MAEKKEMIFEYFVPIESSADLDGDFTINGIAINETTTSNGHKFIGEELRKSASTLIGVPLLKDHDNSVDSIVGKVTMASFNEDMRNIPFKAIVKDPKIKELIQDGLLNSVSVGAHVDPKDIEELENGDIVPHNIQFKELSVCAIGADNGATFQIALNNAYKSHSQNENLSIERGNETMTEEEIKKDESTETPKEEEKKEEKEEPKVEPAVTEEKVKSWVIEAIKSIKESDVDEEPKEEPKEPEKKEEPEEEEDESEEVEEKGDYKITEGHRSFSMERKSYNYN